MGNQIYSAMRLPERLMDQVQDYINENPQLGYTSKAEVVKTAIRKFLTDSKNNGDKGKDDENTDYSMDGETR